MYKRILCFILISIMVGTALSFNDSAFSNGVNGEETVITTEEAITDSGLDKAEEENPTGEGADIKEEIAPDSYKKTLAEDEPEATTPAPIQKTDLITNPYKGYSYARLIKEINELSAQYPDLIDTDYIGTTVGGRKIPLVKLGKGDKKILVVGTEHAREYVTTSLIMRSIDTYSSAYYSNKTIDGTSVNKVLDEVTFYFVPMLNIDGAQIVMGAATSNDKRIAKRYVGSKHFYRYDSLWKANLRGVDLNRNYPFRWSAGKSSKKRAYMNFKGKKKASEPEVKSIVNLCKDNDFAHMFTMHTRGQIIYWKDKYNDVVPGASALSNKVRSITGYRKMPKSGWSTCAGESAKWFRFVYNKPAFTIEVSPSSVPYKKAVKKAYFDKYIWKKNKSLFLKTALTVNPTNKFKVFLNAGKGKASKRYINIKTGGTYGSLPKAKRKGYRFRGWYTSGGMKITSESLATQKKNITIYAKYKKK